MTNAVLTLQVPDLTQGRGVIIAATADRQMLLAFRRYVLQKHQMMMLNADDDIVRKLRSMDYERVKQALDVVVPEDD